MRRAIFVWGAVMEDGSKITTDDYTAVKVNPDKSVEVTDATGSKHIVEGKWVSYIPRFN